MKKKILPLIGVLLVVGAISQPARGFVLMGPPKALFAKGQYNTGIDYSYSEMNLNTEGTWTMDTTSIADNFTIKNLKSNMILGNLGVGIHDKLDTFVRFGMADCQAKVNEPDVTVNFDGNWGFAYGAGIRVTFSQKDDLAWGGLAQINGANTKDSSLRFVADANNIPGEGKINWYEIQIAIGPTWQKDSTCIYGGPLFHFVCGDLDIQGSYDGSPVTGSFNIREKSQFGGYAGFQCTIKEKTTCFAEGIFTGNAWGINIGGLWRFD